MKQAFFQHNMKKNGSIESIMKNGLIILDTNALLNIYRFNNDSREKYFEILNVVKERLFLTYQSVQEFYNNRLTIIYNKSNFKEDLKQELTKKITEINNVLESSNFQSQNKESCNLIKHEQILKNSLIKILNKAKEEIENEINSYNVDIDKAFICDNDPIIDRILEIFEGKINKPFTKDDLEKLYKVGKDRYEAKIPPGYEDIKKPDPACYGDFIIWKEMMNISKDKQMAMLFVSDDRKPDWCEKFKENDLGPNKGLIKEFFEETNQMFHSITTKEFIKYISGLHSIEDTIELEKESAVIENELIKSNMDTAAINDWEELNKYILDPSKLNNWNEIINHNIDLDPVIIDNWDDNKINKHYIINKQKIIKMMKTNPNALSSLDQGCRLRTKTKAEAEAELAVNDVEYLTSLNSYDLVNSEMNLANGQEAVTTAFQLILKLNRNSIQYKLLMARLDSANSKIIEAMNEIEVNKILNL